MLIATHSTCAKSRRQLIRGIGERVHVFFAFSFDKLEVFGGSLLELGRRIAPVAYQLLVHRLLARDSVGRALHIGLLTSHIYRIEARGVE